MKRLSFWIFSFYLLTLIGCKDYEKDSTATSPQMNDTTRYEGLVPMALGNYWVFVDSLRTQIDTAKVVGYENHSGYLWWHLNKQVFAMGDFTDYFAIRNDTVFVNEPLRGGGEITTFIIIPPRDSTISYRYLVGGDAFSTRIVTYYHNGFTVPAGTFQNYVCYVEDIGGGKDSLVIVPNVGVVCRVTEWISYPGSRYNRVTHYLNEYSVKTD